MQSNRTGRVLSRLRGVFVRDEPSRTRSSSPALADSDDFSGFDWQGYFAYSTAQRNSLPNSTADDDALDWLSFSAPICNASLSADRVRNADAAEMAPTVASCIVCASPRSGDRCVCAVSGGKPRAGFARGAAGGDRGGSPAGDLHLSTFAARAASSVSGA